jgi:hypothetical protein
VRAEQIYSTAVRCRNAHLSLRRLRSRCMGRPTSAMPRFPISYQVAILTRASFQVSAFPYEYQESKEYSRAGNTLILTYRGSGDDCHLTPRKYYQGWGFDVIPTYFYYAACLCIPLRYSIVDFLVSAFILYRSLRYFSSVSCQHPLLVQLIT